jgi:hypothetical protein
MGHPSGLWVAEENKQLQQQMQRQQQMQMRGFFPFGKLRVRMTVCGRVMTGAGGAMSV